jgi:hypothetical protein
MKQILTAAAWGAMFGMFFAALFGLALDGAFEDAFRAVKDCARSLR